VLHQWLSNLHSLEKSTINLVEATSTGYKSIAYGKLTAVLIEALKEQQQRLDQMAQRIEALSVSPD